MSHDRQVGTSLHTTAQDNARLLALAEDTVLEAVDQVVRIAPDAGAFTITLPDVGSAAGRTYSFHVLDVDTADPGATTVATVDDQEGNAMGVLDADDDALLLYSDGLRWWELVNEIA